MAGYQAVLKIRRLEEQCNNLGFMFCHSKHGYREYDVIALKPKDQDSLPIYCRDAELFVGSIEELERWIQGIQWARDYDRMLFGKTHESKRERKEQDWRNRNLVQMLTKENNG